MKPPFVMSKDDLALRRHRAGKRRAAAQKIDKAFGWTKRTEVRTRLSGERPLKPVKPESE